jgi:hypothetical protein
MAFSMPQQANTIKCVDLNYISAVVENKGDKKAGVLRIGCMG